MLILTGGELFRLKAPENLEREEFDNLGEVWSEPLDNLDNGDAGYDLEFRDEEAVDDIGDGGE